MEIQLFMKFTRGGGIIYRTLINRVCMVLSEGALLEKESCYESRKYQY